MPSDIGVLTDDEKRLATKWVCHWMKNDGVCPICLGPLEVADHVVENRAFSPTGNFLLGLPAYPFVAMICGKCGHTMFFSAAVMGLEIDRSSRNDDGKSGAKK